eukprot:5485936-Alexandrium_andersonii.AAC.1
MSASLVGSEMCIRDSAYALSADRQKDLPLWKPSTKDLESETITTLPMLWRRPMTAAMISPGRMSCSKPGNTVETAAAALPFLA